MGTGLRIWDAAAGRLLHDFPRDEAAGRLQFSPDGKRLAVLMAPQVHVFDVTTGRDETDIEIKGKGSPQNLAWAPDGTTLAVGTGKGVELWDVKAGTRRQAFPVGRTVSLAWSADGAALLTAGDEPGRDQGGRVSLLDAASGRVRPSFTLPVPGSPDVAALSPDGKLAAAAAGPVIHLWRTDTARPAWTAQGRGRPLLGAGWGKDKDARTIAWGSTFNRDGAGLAQRWPLEQAFDLAELRLAPGRPLADFGRAVLTQDGVALKPHQGAVVRDGQSIHLPGQFGTILCGTLLPGNRAAVGTSFGQVLLADTQTGKEVRQLGLHGGPVEAVVPSADNRYLLTTSADQTLRLWNLAPARGERPHLLTVFVAA
jgi:WD40 repeat protein